MSRDRGGDYARGALLGAPDAKQTADRWQRVERYHKIQELATKQVDVANIARQVGLSRQGVYTYLRMKQPPERTRIHQPGGSNLEP